MAEQVDEVTVSLTNEKVQFSGISKTNPDRPVSFDHKPPIGDGEGFNGLELLLMSFAGSSATAVVYVLRKMGKDVSGLKVIAQGTRKSQPIKFEKIHLEFLVNSKDAQDADVQKAIQLAEESLCPVWQMIKNNAVVESEYDISQ